ncbi:MAG: TetR/AcrR family transcriptional regulator [Candidatus Limivicinus sp.]
MSQEQLKERNIRAVTELALDCFIESGIDNTKVSCIARRAGLTERSVFRYFKTKADLVLAASYLYWNRVIEYINGRLTESSDDLSGLELVRQLLIFYSNLFLEDPKGIRFTLDAELVLNRAGKGQKIKNRPPEPFETSTGPVAKAIKKGLEDGSISRDVDVRELYYDSYDAILGIMQRLSIGGTPSAAELDYKTRMKHLCDLFVSAFSGKFRF